MDELTRLIDHISELDLHPNKMRKLVYGILIKDKYGNFARGQRAYINDYLKRLILIVFLLQERSP